MARTRVNIEVEQGRELARNFNRINRDANNEIERAIVKSALIVERDAKLNCPVDTGRLRQSISHRLVEENDIIAAETGTNVEYAKSIEFGTSRQSAQPFLFPAYNNNKQRIIRELARAFRRGAGL